MKTMIPDGYDVCQHLALHLPSETMRADSDVGSGDAYCYRSVLYRCTRALPAHYVIGRLCCEQKDDALRGEG